MRAFILLSLLALLVGCGASEQQHVAATIRASDAAWDRGDLDEGCSWMTERARRRFMADAINPRARTCAEAYEAPANEATETVGFALLTAVAEPVAPRMTNIRIDGDRAVASYSNAEPTRLRKVNGRWLVDSY